MEKMGNDVESCQLLRPARGRDGRREGKDGGTTERGEVHGGVGQVRSAGSGIQKLNLTLRMVI